MTKNHMLEKFLADSNYIYENWKTVEVGDFSTKIFDKESGSILFHTPIAKHLEPFWTPILKHFEKTRRVITYERRESAISYLGVEDRADDLKKVLDYLSISRCELNYYLRQLKIAVRVLVKKVRILTKRRRQ